MNEALEELSESADDCIDEFLLNKYWGSTLKKIEPKEPLVDRIIDKYEDLNIAVLEVIAEKLYKIL